MRPSPQEAQALLETALEDFREAALQVPLTTLPLQQRDIPNLAEMLPVQPRFPVSMGLEPP